MVVVSTFKESLATGLVVVVCCSTDFTEPLGPMEVPLGSTGDGRGTTKLDRPTVAVCDWNQNMSTAMTRPQDMLGFVLSDVYREVCRVAGIRLTSGR